MANRCGNNGNSDRLYFLRLPKSLQMVSAAMKLKDLLLGRKAMTNLDSVLESRDITLPTKVHIAKAMLFPVAMNGCESWTMEKPEPWRTVVLEKTLESPLDCKKIKPVNPKVTYHCWFRIMGRGLLLSPTKKLLLTACLFAGCPVSAHTDFCYCLGTISSC